MTSYYLWSIIFIIFAYLVVTDNSIATAIVLLYKIVRLWYEKTKWWLIYNPSNPIVKWIVWRKALRLAKEFEKDLKK
jgi:hypothetical protein